MTQSKPPCTIKNCRHTDEQLISMRSADDLNTHIPIILDRDPDVDKDILLRMSFATTQSDPYLSQALTALCQYTLERDTCSEKDRHNWRSTFATSMYTHVQQTELKNNVRYDNDESRAQLAAAVERCAQGCFGDPEQYESGWSMGTVVGVGLLAALAIGGMRTYLRTGLEDDDDYW